MKDEFEILLKRMKILVDRIEAVQTSNSHMKNGSLYNLNYYIEKIENKSFFNFDNPEQKEYVYREYMYRECDRVDKFLEKEAVKTGEKNA